MKAVVVYESHWGNTEAVARAIAAGIGQGANRADDGRGGWAGNRRRGNDRCRGAGHGLRPAG